MFSDAALGFINHILGNEYWARIQLKVFKGQTVRLEFGQLSFLFEINSEGYFKPGSINSVAAVTLSFPADSLFESLCSSFSLKSDVRISGSAHLTECLLTVFTNLRLDLESDLSEVVGDIAAHRLVLGGKRLFLWQLTSAQKLSRNLVEYLSMDNPMLAHRRKFSALFTNTDNARIDLDALENRIALLEK